VAASCLNDSMNNETAQLDLAYYDRDLQIVGAARETSWVLTVDTGNVVNVQ